MFKLMIADDSPYVLQTLMENTDWENFDFDLIGAYRDGKTLLEAARTTMPDLVITDISMPGMDGIQLSSQLYQLYPNIKIIFISEHSEFEYVKKALNLHIFDYILKPICTEQLTEVMKKVLLQLQKEQRQQFEQQAARSQQDCFRKAALLHYASRLLFRTDSEVQVRREFEKLGILLPEHFHLYLVCYALSQSLSTCKLANPHSYFQSLLEDDLVESQIIPLTMEDQQGMFLLIMHSQNIPVPDRLSRLCVDVESQMDLCITMGYSDPATDFSSLPKLHDQAGTLQKHLGSTLLNVPIISYRDINMETDTSCKEKSNTAPGNPHSKNVAAMVAFIEKHYMNPITVHDVARSVFLSPSHANLCFNNECGMTIFGYTTHYRMEKAKELLRDTDEKVTRIAELVGYGGKTSFYLAFKRYIGISPTDYRLQNSN